jgi:hypothetical protein
LGALLALLVGGVFGSFSARFTWSLFGARFGARDPIIGICIIAVLLVIYSLPLYSDEFGRIWTGLGLKSVKTPGGVELTFSDAAPPLRGGIVSANNGQQELPSAVSNPSNPQPGLNGLESAVSNDENSYIVKDDRYISYFSGNPVPVLDPKQTQFKPSNQILEDTLRFLMPGKVLVGCLRQYVNIFPDSQLVLIDTKPVIQWLFRLHAYGERQLEVDKITGFKSSKELSRGFEQAVEQVRTNVLSSLGINGQSIDTPDAVLTPDLEGQSRADASLITDYKLSKSAELSRLLSQSVPSGETGLSSGEVGLSPVDKFVISCSKSQLEVQSFPDNASLQILQPYTSIALANLLVAHGSPDEAIIVLTQWIDLWR